MNEQPDWLKLSISRGLQSLYVLHLEGTPPAETIDKTAAIWYRIIKNWPINWTEELDRARLTSAFLALGSQVQRWPSPSQLRPLIPARAKLKALPTPEYPPEKAASNLKKIKTLLNGALKTF